MINLGAQYEIQQKYDIACKWYKLSILIEPNCLEAYFGFALSAFKEGRPQDGVDHLTIAIEKLNNVDITDRNKRHLIFYRYLRSLCYRVMQDFKKSQKDYKDILRAFEIEEGSKFAQYIFAMILMPMEVNRRKILKYVEGFRSVMDLYEAEKDRRILSQHYLAYVDKELQYKIKTNVD